MKKICFIVDNYPSKYNIKGVFIRNLAVSLRDNDINIIIICPRLWTLSSFLNDKDTYYSEDITPYKKTIKVYRPWYIHFPLRKKIILVTLANYKNCILSTLKKERIRPDILYSHFICPAGIITSIIGKKLGIPSFLCVGESTRMIPNNVKGSDIYEYGLKHLYWQKYLNELSGIICVSKFVKELLIKYNFINIHKQKNIEVIENAIDENIFKPMNKTDCRQKLHLPNDKFIIIFNGALDDNKGYLRLANVLNKINKQIEIYSIFITRGGNIKPIYVKNQLYFGKCKNKELPYWLNSSDIFILPTLCEGCCNAIIEAIACGIPVISSNKSFNDNILNENNSIRIDTSSEVELYNAILKLYNNKELLLQLKDNNIINKYYLSINKRSEKIKSFIGNTINEIM